MGRMTSSTVLRRAWRRVFALVLALTVTSMIQPPSAVSAVSVPRSELLAGDAGSGPQDPVVVEHAPRGARFKDVSSSSWALSAINYVAVSHNWMDDYGSRFRPNLVETRP